MGFSPRWLHEMIEQNYWLSTTEFPKTDPIRPLPEVVDVAVIGAGFTGLSAARSLAKRGAKVAVLDSETVGWGASSRNGGMVLTGLKLGVNKLISMYGRERTQRSAPIAGLSQPCGPSGMNKIPKILRKPRLLRSVRLYQIS